MWLAASSLIIQPSPIQHVSWRRSRDSAVVGRRWLLSDDRGWRFEFYWRRYPFTLQLYSRTRWEWNYAAACRLLNSSFICSCSWKWSVCWCCWYCRQLETFLYYRPTTSWLFSNFESGKLGIVVSCCSCWLVLLRHTVL